MTPAVDMSLDLRLLLLKNPEICTEDEYISLDLTQASTSDKY